VNERCHDRKVGAVIAEPQQRPGEWSRRRLFAQAAAVGLGTPAARALLAAPAGAAPSAQADAQILTIAMNGSPSDLDPHSAYDYRSAIATRGPYETLIALTEDKTDEYVGVVAESWSANEDQSVWTFKIRPGVAFQDGSPCDAEAVRLSFERLLTLQMGAYNVIGRFVSDPGRITAPDAQTLVFDIGEPAPLFEAAVSGQFGPLIVNA
jgi:ABC-type transport system substrate-binding protein